jgi:hypothetical protein
VFSVQNLLRAKCNECLQFIIFWASVVGESEPMQEGEPTRVK